MNSKAFFTKQINVTLIATLCTLLWGSAIPCIKTGYILFGISNIASRMLFAGYRFFLAGLLTLAVAFFITKKPPVLHKKSVALTVLLGLIQTTLEYVFFYIGVAFTTGVKGSILNAAGTFIAVVLAHFFYKEDKLTLKRVLGCVIGFFGIITIHIGGKLGGFSFLGEGFMMLAAISFAVGSLICKKLSKTADPIVMTGYQLSIGGFLLILIGVLFGGKLTPNGFAAFGILAYMIFLSAAAFTLWTVLLKHNSVGRVSIYNFLTPVFGVFLSGIILKEPIFTLTNFVALLLVCIGIKYLNSCSN